MEKFLENLQEAQRTIHTVDHMTYVTFPLMKDKRLLLKILLEIKKAVTNCLNSILQYEYLYKRINLYKSPHTNFKTFQEKCAPRYDISQNEISLIIELFDIAEKHRQSPFEFLKEDKIVILSDNMNSKTVSLEKIKEFLRVAKGLLGKIEKKIKN